MTRAERETFAILSALYWVLLYPILRADRYYNDDLKRSLLGRTGWDSNGRPLTTFLMKVLQCYDHALVDISPFTQIAAVGLLAWAGVLLKRHCAIRSPMAAALLAFPLGAQPFFLENLSYKFDSLSMAAALLMALLPIIGGGSGRRGWWPGVLALFASLALYQPAITAFLVFALLEVTLGQAVERTPGQLLRRLASRAMQIGIAMALYQLLIGLHIHGWVARNAELVTDPRQGGLVFRNALLFWRFVGESLNAHWWAYFAPVFALLGLVAVVAGVAYALRRRHGQPAWVTAACVLAGVLLPAAALACVAGPMLFLVRPLLMARVLVGIGPLLVAALLCARSHLLARGRGEIWSSAIAAMLAIGMCVVASAYGNAAAAQKEYEQRTAALFAEQVGELHVAHPVDSYLVDGSVGLAPLTAHVGDHFPLVRGLILPYIDGANNFVTRNFLRFYLPELVRSNQLYADSWGGKAILDQTCRVAPAFANDRLAVYLVGTTAVLAFRGAHEQRCSARAQHAALSNPPS